MKGYDPHELFGECSYRQRTRWYLALSVVLASHAAVGLGLSYKSLQVPEVAGGAPMVIEIAEFAAAPATAASVPAAPPVPTETPQQHDVREPAPKIPEPESQIPELEPEIPEPKPQLAQKKLSGESALQPTPVDLPKPKPKPTIAPKEVVQERPLKQEQEYQPREESADALQPESVSAPTAETVAATSQSTTKQIETTGMLTQQRATWEDRLAAHLERHKRYPYMARSRREAGTVLIRFIMNREGEIIESYIDRGSGSFLLDREVKDMLRRAKPLPPPPDEVAGNRLELVLPIEFALR